MIQEEVNEFNKKSPPTGRHKQKGPSSLLLSRLHTIVAVMMLNFRVRDGNGCVHHAIAARSSRDPSKPDTSSLLISTLSNLGQVLGLLVPPR